MAHALSAAQQLTARRNLLFAQARVLDAHAREFRLYARSRADGWAAPQQGGKEQGGTKSNGEDSRPRLPVMPPQEGGPHPLGGNGERVRRSGREKQPAPSN